MVSRELHRGGNVGHASGSPCTALRLVAVLLLPLLVPTLGARQAWAKEPTAADKDAAREAFADGEDLRAQKEYKASLLKYKAAFDLVPSPITALELGRAHVLVGELVEGRKSCLIAASLPPKPEESSTAKVARAEARALAEELATRIPSIVVKLVGGAGANLTVDGHAAEAAVKIEVNPGKHHVVAKLAGSEDQRADVELEEKESREVVLTFAPATPTPLAQPTPDPESSVSTLTYVGFGIAGAGVLVGGVSGVLAMSKASHLKGSCVDFKCLPPEHDAVDSYNRMATISTVSFVIGAIGAGVGIYALLTKAPPSAAEQHAVRVEPWIGLGSVGLGGAF